jgi:cell division septation protein DedD
MKTRKKIKGGAQGLVLNIMYNDDDEIIDIKVQDLVARNDYIKKHGFDPKPAITWNSIKRNIFEPTTDDKFDSLNQFLYGETPTNKTKKKYMRFAVNSKQDVRLVAIANKIIKMLNKTKNSLPDPIKITRTLGRLDDKCKAEIESKYDRILREHEGSFLKEVDSEKDKKVAKVLLRNPFLVNLIGSKFGILKQGDLKLEELEDMFQAYEPTIEHTKPGFIDRIMEDRLQKIQDNNRELEAKIQKYKDMVVRRVKEIEKQQQQQALENSPTTTSPTATSPTATSPTTTSPTTTSPTTTSLTNAPLAKAPLKTKVNLSLEKYKQFGEMLLHKFSNKTNIIEREFKKATNKKEYIDAIIVSIIKCLDLNNIYGANIEDEEVRQATMLTLIRICLTPQWENQPNSFFEFQKVFINVFQNDPNVTNFCQALEDAFKSRSLLGLGYSTRYKTWNYYQIKKNFFYIDDNCSNTENITYEQIININLAKLYDRIDHYKDVYLLYKEDLNKVDKENPFYKEIARLVERKTT